jgi:Ni/Co efflux regulator RcnB
VRKVWILATAAAAALIASASPASAQQRVWQGGRWVSMPHRTAPHVMRTNPHRWQMHNGRWNAGWQAPGGWGAYRRLHRGARLPQFWMGSSYHIPDYLSFGLAAPPRGYHWTRYYDDAVLVDDGGQVWDSVGDIAWAGAEAGYGGSYSSSHSYSNAQVGASYSPPGRIEQVDPEGYYDDDREPIPSPAPYPGGYAPPVAPPPPAVHFAPPVVQQCYQSCGGGYQGGAYQGGGYAYGVGSTYSGGTYYAGGGTTTVIITPAPVVTTTTVTEEIIEESVSTSYVRAAPRKLVRRATKVRPRCVCR